MEKRKLQNLKQIIIFLTISVFFTLTLFSKSYQEWILPESYKDKYDTLFIERMYYNRSLDRYFDELTYIDYNYLNYYYLPGINGFFDLKIIENYPHTEEFEETHPNYLILRGLDSGEEYILSTSEYGKYKENLSSIEIHEEVEIVEVEEFEEPKIVTYKEDPQDLKKSFEEIEISDYKGKNVLMIKGQIKDQELQFLESEKQVEKEWEKKASSYEKELEKEIKSSFRYLRTKPEIEEFNFVYSIDLDSKSFGQARKMMDYDQRIFPVFVINLTLSAFLYLVFSFILNYKKNSKEGLLGFVQHFPMEVVFILFIFWMVPFLVVSDAGGMDTSVADINKWLAGLTFWFLSVTLGLAIFYTIMWIKSIYHDGLKSDFIQSSLLYKAGKGVKNFLLGSISRRHKKAEIYVTLFFAGLGLFLFLFFVEFSMEFFFLSGWILLTFIVYKVVRTFFNELDFISDEAEKIADGDYGYCINPEQTHFKDLANLLNRMGMNLEDAVEEALKSERTQTELITNVSHDLKTPLTSIINYSELLNNEEDEEKRKEYSEIIRDKSLVLSKLINDLFEVSKVATDNIELDFVLLDFKEMMEQMIGEWSEELSQKDLELVISLPEEPVILKLDANKSYRVLDNIMSNIYKYSQKSTRVYIDFTKEDGKVICSFKNISEFPLNISAEELMKRFRRGDISRQTEGSGLGLSIASSLTKAQNGEFNIDILGDVFSVTLEFQEELDD